jgi:hypothetical protein
MGSFGPNRQGPFNWPYGPNGVAGDNVTNLASGYVVGLGVVFSSNLAAPYADVILPVWQITTGSNVSGAGTLARYLVMAENPLLFTGGLNPNGGNQATLLNNYLETTATATAFMLLDTVQATLPNTAYYFLERFLFSFIGSIPTYLGMLLSNQTGGNLASTPGAHSVTYSVDASLYFNPV